MTTDWGSAMRLPSKLDEWVQHSASIVIIRTKQAYPCADTDAAARAGRSAARPTRERAASAGPGAEAVAPLARPGGPSGAEWQAGTARHSLPESTYQGRFVTLWWKVENRERQH
ncbi:hypothetical protein GCM10010515_24700 [Streptomyces fructofermentans]|uniref:Uncharacterized protein n=1 Tax=Streptomyces fructofermentans TaxID=152141 RepID=A0A918NBV4_9ACTN|nr:hypothetical protein GCM10010515_24700 [Streptomyces fructofermentans]